MSDPFSFDQDQSFWNGGAIDNPPQGQVDPSTGQPADPAADPNNAPATSFVTNGQPLLASPDFSNALLHAGIGVLQANEAGQGVSGIIAGGLEGYSNALDQQYAKARQSRNDDLTHYALLGQIQARQTAQLAAVRRLQAQKDAIAKHPELADLYALDPDAPGKLLANQMDPLYQAKLAETQRGQAINNIFAGGGNATATATATASAPTDATGAPQPLNVRNNNPGNMKNPDGTFQTFATPAAGMDALTKDLTTKITGKSAAMMADHGAGYKPTLSNLITTWAPPSENDTNSYIANVSKQTGIGPDQVLTTDDISKLAPALIAQEGGNKATAAFGGAGPTASDPSKPTNPYSDLAAKYKKASEIDPGGYAEKYISVLKDKTEWDTKNGVGGMNDIGVAPQDADKTGIDLINAHPNAAVRNRAAALLHGDEPFPSAQAQKNPVTNQALQLVEAADPGYNVSTAQNRKEVKSKYAAGAGEAANVQALNTTVAHIGKYAVDTQAEGNTSYKPVNYLKNILMPLVSQKSDTKVGNVSQDTMAAGTETSKSYKGAGSLSEGEQKDWQSQLGTSKGPLAARNAAQNVGTLLLGKINAQQNEWHSAFPNQPREFLTPESKAILQQQLGIDLKFNTDTNTYDYTKRDLSNEKPQANVTLPSNSSDGAGQVYTPKTQADYDAIPSGSVYVGSDGKQKRKK